jgi:hypothetical protein
MCPASLIPLTEVVPAWPLGCLTVVKVKLVCDGDGCKPNQQSTDLDRTAVGANIADRFTFCQRGDRYCGNDGCERVRNLRRNRPTRPKKPAPNRKRLLGSAVVMVSKSIAMYA